MGAGDIIKEYLVALGFDVDMNSYQKFDRTLKEMSAKVSGHTTGTEASYVKAATVVTSALASIGFATVGLINKIAGADLEYQKFAQHMFMGRDAAQRMMIATDALGESIEDIAWNPELRDRYLSLTGQMKNMEQPTDAKAQLKYIRDMRFEFTRLKVETTYGMQWVGYHLIKNLAGPLKSAKEWLTKLNEKIVQNMPEWSEKVAQFLTVFINIGTSAWRTVMNIWDGLKGMWDMMPGWAQGVAIALAVAVAPISPAIKIIGLLLLLMEDFYAYIDGRKSSKVLAPIWDTLIAATDTVVRGIVSAMVLIDALYDKVTGNSKKTFGEIWDTVKAEWNNAEGTIGTLKKPMAQGKSLFSPSADENSNKERINTIKNNSQRAQELASNVTSREPSNDRPVMVTAFQAKDAIRQYQTMSNFNTQSTVTSKVVGDNNVKIDMGGIEVHINQPNATPREVYDATSKALSDGMKKEAARFNREFTGAY